jgi:putative membrane protein
MAEKPYTGFSQDELILRDHLAIARTVLANERTFLAYIRTALTFLIVGLSFLKFFTSAVTFYFGWIFVVFALFTLSAGFTRFKMMKGHIRGRKDLD